MCTPYKFICATMKLAQYAKNAIALFFQQSISTTLEKYDKRNILKFFEQRIGKW